MNDTCILIKFNYARSTKPRIVRMDVQNYDCISVYPIQLSQHVISKEERRDRLKTHRDCGYKTIQRFRYRFLPLRNA